MKAKPSKKFSDDVFPHDRSNIISQLFFFWINPLVTLGSRRPLEDDDLWQPDEDKKASVWGNLLEKEWNQEKATSAAPSLMRVMWNLLWKNVLAIGVLKLTADVMTSLTPLLIRETINFVSKKRDSQNMNDGYYLAVGLFLMQAVGSLLSNQAFHHIQTLSLKARSAFYSTIFYKATKLSSLSRQDYDSGKVTNIITSDVKRVEDFLFVSNTAWTAPIQIIVIVTFLCIMIGPAALAGIAILFALSPVQKRLFGKLLGIRKLISPVTDARVKQTQEVIEGIRVIKFFAWEIPFNNRIKELRVKELKFVLQKGIYIAFVTVIAFAIPTFAATISFVIYSTTHTLNAGDIFGALALFQQLRMPLMFLPRVIATYAEFKIAIQRMQGLLLAEELETGLVIDPDCEYGVYIEDGEFIWENKSETSYNAEEARRIVEVKSNAQAKNDFGVSESNQTVAPSVPPVSSFKLTDINLKIPKGKFVAIVGAVGSGKSSLLNSLICETKQISGVVKFSGKVGYAAQEAWILNATVRENILFGEPFSEKRYLDVLNVCQLENDLKQWPDRDNTEIGERGINLSGGQKQRINIARLVYSNPDIVLLDDPLSALDAHVGRHLFEKCMKGVLAGKTIILVTHQLNYLPKVDLIYVMKSGKVAEFGTFNELSISGGEFSSLMENYGIKDINSSLKNTTFSTDNEISTRIGMMILEGNKTKAREVLQKEDRDTGVVKANIWMTYFRIAGGWPYICGIIVIMILSQVTRVGNDYWLVFWVSNEFQSFSDLTYILIYFSWGFMFALVMYGFGIYLAFGSVRAGSKLHQIALDRIFQAPTSFFDSTPQGRIISRFSKDQDTIDNTMMESFRFFLVQAFTTAAAFVVILVSTPWFILTLLPAFGLYYYFQLRYRAISREIKRIESIRRSPLYALLGETLNGLPTIRAYGKVDFFIERNNQLVDYGVSPSFLLNCIGRWLGVRFEFIGALLFFFAALFGVVARTTINPAVLGLSLSYASQVTNALNWCIRQFAETEITMNSVERLAYYAFKLEQEPAPIIQSNRPPKNWPASGSIIFENVSLKYAADLPEVLKNISFEIKPQEKVGIVGRTGSGKSSLIQVIFRMFETSQGKIIIDEINTQQIGLHDLRKPIGIITQDPVLFSGTIRSNLDPFDEYSDAAIWEALRRANINQKVSESGGLESQVLAGGENFSVGQRQLFCLARSILARPTILIMDEATANVDYESDAIIQDCIRSDFKQATILTIAHRLNTVMDYDRIMVLDEGKVVEFDTPQNLLQINEGVFSKLVKQAN